MDERTLYELSLDIQMKRREMYSLANQYGYSDDRTVRNSQELDEMIVKYQNYLCSGRRQELKTSVYMKIIYQSSSRDIQCKV